MAYNLGEQWVSVDSIRGADEVTMKAVSDAAFAGIKSPKLGLQIMLKQGVANADYSMDRRHGEGQAIANIRFREFQADMVEKYGDAALGGLETFNANHVCHKEIVSTLNNTLALISNKPDARILYGMNPPEYGNSYNSKLREFMRCIFVEARDKKQKNGAA